MNASYKPASDQGEHRCQFSIPSAAARNPQPALKRARHSATRGLLGSFDAAFCWLSMSQPGEQPFQVRYKANFSPGIVQGQLAGPNLSRFPNPALDRQVPPKVLIGDMIRRTFRCRRSPHLSRNPRRLHAGLEFLLWSRHAKPAPAACRAGLCPGFNLVVLAYRCESRTSPGRHPRISRPTAPNGLPLHQPPSLGTDSVLHSLISRGTPYCSVLRRYPLRQRRPQRSRTRPAPRQKSIHYYMIRASRAGL